MCTLRKKMESNKVGDENTSLKDDTSNIGIISTNIEYTSVIRENSSSNTESHDYSWNATMKTETNFDNTKSIDFADCSLQNLAQLKKIEINESNRDNECLVLEEKNLLDDMQSKKLEYNLEKVKTIFTIVSKVDKTKKDNKDTVGNVENDEKNENDQKEVSAGKVVQCIKEMKETMENKNTLIEQESFMIFSELQLPIANENDLLKSCSTKDEIMEQETIISNATVEKIIVQAAIEKEPQNVPLIAANIQAVQENKQNSSTSDRINDTVNVKNDENSIDTKNMKKSEVQKAITSLAFIASAYDNSDSESDEPQCIYEQKSTLSEMEVQIMKEYRNKPTVTSLDDESSSDVSSEQSDNFSAETDSDASDVIAKTSANCNKKNRCKASQEKEMKGEFDDLPPIEELKISVPEVLCDPLGKVGWMVEQMVVVRPTPGKPTLNIDTILFVDRGRRVLGRIFDVFGQVSEPHYCIRFNSTEHIKESDIKVGMIVYFCPNTEYTSVVFLQDLMKMKATDEFGDDEHPEFSDDEEERAYYSILKQKQKHDKIKSSGEAPQKRQRTDGQDPSWKSNHPWSTGRKQQQQQQAKKPGKMYKTSDWSATQQPSGCHPSNLWQYPSSYSNDSWPDSESYQRNGWPQNPYGYNEPFASRHEQGTTRPFFRPSHTFQFGPDPYMHNLPYPPQPNPTRYPAMNFLWQSQAPRQPDMPWPLPPLPPPPPGI